MYREIICKLVEISLKYTSLFILPSPLLFTTQKASPKGKSTFYEVTIRLLNNLVILMFSSSQLLYLAATGKASNKMQTEILQISWRLCQRGAVIPVTSTDQQDTCHILKGSV